MRHTSFTNHAGELAELDDGVDHYLFVGVHAVTHAHAVGFGRILDAARRAGILFRLVQLALVLVRFTQPHAVAAAVVGIGGRGEPADYRRQPLDIAHTREQPLPGLYWAEVVAHLPHRTGTVRIIPPQ